MLGILTTIIVCYEWALQIVFTLNEGFDRSEQVTFMHPWLGILLVLELSQEVIEVFFIIDLTLMPFEQRQYQLVEEYPLVLEEFVKKVTHVITRYDWGKKAENPFTRIHIGSYVVLGHFLMEDWKVGLDQKFDH